MFFKMPFKVRNIEIHANLSNLLLPIKGFGSLLTRNDRKTTGEDDIFNLIPISWQFWSIFIKEFAFLVLMNVVVEMFEGEIPQMIEEL